MSRPLPALVGLAVLVAAGVVHGLWTDRWRPSAELADAQGRVALLPDDLGAWRGQPYEQDPLALEMAGAVTHYSRTFADPVTGDKVLVMLLVGKAARMCVHRPEHCYTSAGWAMAGRPVEVKIQPPDMESAEFDTALFGRDEAAGPSQMRIFWSFGSRGGWSVPSSPRWRFAREPMLYKLYVLRNVAGKSGPVESRDPCIRLLGELLPVLDKTLSRERQD